MCFDRGRAQALAIVPDAPRSHPKWKLSASAGAPAWPRSPAPGPIEIALREGATGRPAGSSRRPVYIAVVNESESMRSDATTSVFISSTVEDLIPYRERVRDAILMMGAHPSMMEYFTASGEHPPLEGCLEAVRASDVVIVVVAHRYGWVPTIDANRLRHSITWLECQEAIATGKEVIAFIVSDSAPWDNEFRDDFELVRAVRRGELTAELADEISARVTHLGDFKRWLRSRGFCASFDSAAELSAQVTAALHGWIRGRGETGRKTSGRNNDELSREYARVLLSRVGAISIRGLDVGGGTAHRFPIEKLFVELSLIGAKPAVAARTVEEGRQSSRSQVVPRWADFDLTFNRKRKPLVSWPVQQAVRTSSGEALLRDMFSSRRVVIIGDPGSGKSTCLNYVAALLCKARLGVEYPWRSVMGPVTPLPLCVRVDELDRFIARRAGSGGGMPVSSDSSTWLAHYCEAKAAEMDVPATAPFFQELLKTGDVAVLLDGLDEAPDRRRRDNISRLVENAAADYPLARFVVTSRPAAYTDETVIEKCDTLFLSPLSDDAISHFLRLWCEAVYGGDRRQAASHYAILADSFLSRAEITLMARTPVMLTALAVVHWNERQLPQQRSELYASVIKWLSRSRESRPGRVSPERSVAILQELALAMQMARPMRQTQVSRRWAAEQISLEFPGSTIAQRVDAAERFLGEEELDSGIIVARGSECRFWHLTFQEYLAARALAGRPDEEQTRVFGAPDYVINQAEWREVVLLFSGVLHYQGHLKLDRFVTWILRDTRPKTPALIDDARACGLVASIVRDLSPLGYFVNDDQYGALASRFIAIFEDGDAAIPMKIRVEAADALGQVGDPRFDESFQARTVRIKAGVLTTGDRLSEIKRAPVPGLDDGPIGVTVAMQSFSISKWLVTVREFAEFVEDGGYLNSLWWSHLWPGRWRTPELWEQQVRYPTRPVSGVSWFEADAYCRWAGVRLPTELEWEFVAAGTNHRAYPWGDGNPDADRANVGGVLGHVSPVGMFPKGATPDGVHDVVGNLWEWCEQLHDEKTLRLYDPNTLVRPLRGGSWSTKFDLAACLDRNWASAFSRSATFGFRYALKDRTDPL